MRKQEHVCKEVPVVGTWVKRVVFPEPDAPSNRTDLGRFLLKIVLIMPAEMGLCLKPYRRYKICYILW